MSFSAYSKTILGLFSASLQDFSTICPTHSDFRPNQPPLPSPSLRQNAKERSDSQATLQEDSQKINLPFLGIEESIMHFPSYSFPIHQNASPPSLLLPTISYISDNLSVCSTFLSDRIHQNSQATDSYT